MNDSTISVRYARALIESAREQQLLDEIRQDMQLLQQVCTVSEFRFLLRAPMLKDSQKINMIGGLIRERVQPLTMNLVELVVSNGRELFLPGIARNYLDLYYEEKGIRAARLVTAAPMEQELRDKIVGLVSKTLDTKVELEVSEDPELIGGFVMRIEDQQYDASVAASLKKMKKRLLNK